MTELNDLKREHKKLETITKKATKKRLNESRFGFLEKLKRIKKN